MNWLDLKLGGRLLVKYPGLTLVGGLAMAFAIWAGTVTFEVVTLFVHPTLPLVAGERIVELRNWDVAANTREEHLLHDFVAWRDGLQSITELGAWRDSSRNLIVTAGDARSVQVAEMSASGFRVAGAEPLLGRVLADADEQAAAPPVAVIGYAIWRTRFGSDPNVVGRTLQLGNEYMTVVGVMREGFAFPVSHDVWLPLRVPLLQQAPRSGPAVSVFGMLAPGETLATAQAELATVGRRAATELPVTHQHLEPRVTAYAHMFAAESDVEVAVMYSIYFFAFLLLVLVFGNVGLLLFARAATRESDLVVRTALGASRGRLVSQMFAEALVLGGVAAVVGLTAADFALRNWGTTFLELNLGRLPFWFDVRLSPGTALFGMAFTVFGAAVAGALPALKITRGLGARLKHTSAGGGGLRFGGVWTAVIVAQVAVTVAFPGLVYWEQFQLRRISRFDPGFASEQYLAATVEPGARVGPTLEELRRRVAAQAGVAGVTFADRVPAAGHPQLFIEMGYDATTGPPAAGAATAQAPLREANIAGVDPSYFDVLEAPVRAGRTFSAAEAATGAKVAIVDQGFVDQVLQGRNPIGQQVRFPGTGADPPVALNTWYEVVGVVKDLGVGAPTQRRRAAGFYIPRTADRLGEIHMLVHVRGADPITLAPRVREIATAVDPSLRLGDVQRASEVNNGIMWLMGLWLKITVAMSAVAIVLSLAGIYAVMSFTVARRSREIGIRVALGASRARVIGAIFRRPVLQVALGILVGTSAIFTVAMLAKHTEFPGSESGLSLAAIGMLLAHAGVMLGVCLLACVVPTRRALAVEPTTVLRAD